MSHNLPAVIELFKYLDSLKIKGKIYVIYGSMSNKDIAGIYKHVDSSIAQWHLIGLTDREQRGASITQLKKIFGENDNTYYHDSAGEIFQKLSNQLTNDDCLLIFGSFILIGNVLEQYEKET